MGSDHQERPDADEHVMLADVEAFAKRARAELGIPEPDAGTAAPEATPADDFEDRARQALGLAAE